MICPICASVLPAGTTLCPGCHTELKEYLSARYQPDLLFNEALRCLERKNHADACTLLCLANAMRPDDAGILALWVRSEYLYGNKRRAVELMSDLIELEGTPERLAQFQSLAEEYDREQSPIT